MKIDAEITGRWVTENEDSDVELIIDFQAGVPSVTAHCRSDHEKLEVINLRTEGDVLSFETVVPSSGYRARNSMRFLNSDNCELELTTWERWKKVN